ncbi:MAG: RICIN domain-containing protein [Actinoallomurus sp.]
MAFPRAITVVAVPLIGPMAAIGVANASTAPAHTPARAVFTATLINRHSDLCLSVDGASTGNGARVLQWTCGTQANQQWNLAATDGGYYRVLAVNSGKCMSVSDGSTGNGSAVIQWDCGSRDNQQWKLVQRDDGYFSIVARHSGKCLTLSGYRSQNGATAVQSDCDAGHEQHWRLG